MRASGFFFSCASIATCVAMATMSAACSEGREMLRPFDTGVGTEDTGTTQEDVTSDLVRMEDAMMTGMDASDDRSTPPPTDTGVLTDRVDPPRDVPSGPVDVTVIVMGAPMNAPDRFTGAEVPSIAAPEIVYPATGTVIPPNLRGLEYHLRGPSGVELYELGFVGTNGRVRVYAPCGTPVGGGCVIPINDEAMGGIARAAGGGELRVTVRSRTSAGVGRTTSATLGVSSTDIRGGVYYWTVEALTNSIQRFEWGIGMSRSEAFVTGNAFACVGCHSLSRNGARVAVGVGIPGPASTSTYDAASRMTLGAAYPANFMTFSPDNVRLLTSNGASLTLRTPMAGVEIPGLPSDRNGTHPDWSPDGRFVVYSRPSATVPIPGTPGHNPPANLNIMAWNPGTTSFGNPTTILTSMGENNYYPHFAADSDWVIFNRSTGGSSSAPDARLWAMRTSVRGEPPVEFVTANGTGNLTNSWPRWAPFRDNYDGGPIYWFTFSSHRDYGLRLNNSSAMSPTAQLWMAAFRIQRGEMRMDPSTPPFWLPFQSVRASNHIAQWTEQVQRRSCTMDMDCPMGERCVPLISAGGNRCVGGM
ncbi:MAG: hypothetical protein JNK05_40180 [Myxococcales bacterium]|nr:hypothetical protein [Myxococcales bacterium]